MNARDEYSSVNEKEKKRQAIMNNNNLNVWQKKHMLDELDGKSSLAPTIPTLPVTPDNSTTKQDFGYIKPKAVVTNPFTYLVTNRSVEEQASGGVGAPPMDDIKEKKRKEILNDSTMNPWEKSEWLRQLEWQSDSTNAKTIIPKTNKGWVDESTLRDSNLFYDLPKVVFRDGKYVPEANTESKEGLWAAGTGDTVTAAAIKEARKFLDDRIMKDSLSYATINRSLEKERESFLVNNQNVSQLLAGADLGLAAGQGFGEATQQVGNPQNLISALCWAGGGIANTLTHMFGEGPGFSDINNMVNGSRIQNEMDKINEKIAYVNNSDYKYLVSHVTDIYPGGPNGILKSRIKDQLNEISNKVPNCGTREENERYKSAYTSYLQRILAMNEKADITEKTKAFEEIDKKYQ